MELLQGYLVSLTAAALLAALCQAVMPPGTAKRVSSFTCALLLFVVTVRPILRTDIPLLLSRWENAYTALAVHDMTLEETGFSMTQQLIERQTGAYIQSKAEEEGIFCQAVIRCREEQGVPVPEEIRWIGEPDEHCREKLVRLSQEELGIPEERVFFVGEEDVDGGNAPF